MKTIFLAALCVAPLTSALAAQTAIRINDPAIEPKVGTARISPSGDWVAYTHFDGTKQELVVRDRLTSPGGSRQLIDAVTLPNRNLYGVTWRNYVANGLRTEDVVYVRRDHGSIYIERVNIGPGASSRLVGLPETGTVRTDWVGLQDAAFHEWFIYSYQTSDSQIWPPIQTRVLAAKSALTGQGYVLESNVAGLSYGAFDTVELSNGEVHALYTTSTSSTDAKLYSCKIQPTHGTPTLIQAGSVQQPLTVNSASYVGTSTDVIYAFELNSSADWLARWDSSTNNVTLLTNALCDAFAAVRTQPSDLSSTPAAPLWSVFSHRPTAAGGARELGMCRLDGGGIVPVAKRGIWFVNGANQAISTGDVTNVSLSASGTAAAFTADGQGNNRDAFVTELTRPISIDPTARIGQSVSVEVPVEPTERCSLFLSPSLISPMFSLPGFAGRIEIDTTVMLPIYLNQTPTGGSSITTSYSVPNDPALICTRVYMQAIRELIAAPGTGDITRSTMLIINQ